MRRREKWFSVGYQTILIFISLLAVSCSSKKSNPVGPRNNNHSRTITIQSGNNQTARVGTSVTTPPSVIVKDSSGNPLQGIVVQFSLLSGGGIITKALDTTGVNGIAAVTVWTLGDSAGENILIATAAGVPNDTAQITATARWPYWTVMVYMAADNNLSDNALVPLQSMDSANVNPEIQIIVQAELSQSTYSTLANNDPIQAGTFRYAFKNPGGIDANEDSVDWIGDRNMTDPNELRDFVQYSKESCPAQNYVLVLWNHGGGYRGLLQDNSSAPGSIMSLPQLAGALQQSGGVDVVFFDMCLMGGFESLVQLSTVTDCVVFSEEEIIFGDRSPYKNIIETMQLNPLSNPEQVAEIIADKEHGIHTGDLSLHTISAYKLSGVDQLVNLMQDFVTYLDANFGGNVSIIDHAARVCQKYSFSEIKDLADFLDTLSNITMDSQLAEKAIAVRNLIKGNLRLRNYKANGDKPDFDGTVDVSRSQGLSIFLPSSEDLIADEGYSSATMYFNSFGNSPWTDFLSQWVAIQSQVNFVDLGINRLEAYLVWDTIAAHQSVDIDLWILEPNGEVYSPAFGSVSPNGTFTADSYYTGAWYEGYMMNRFVQEGTYTIYAWLVSDPNDYQPIYDLQYRLSLNDVDYTSLFAGSYPSLSLDSSWLSDLTPTEDELNSFAYSDLQPVTTFEVSEVVNPTVRLNKEAHPVTSAQFRTMKSLVSGTKAKNQHQQKASSQNLQPNWGSISPIRK